MAVRLVEKLGSVLGSRASGSGTLETTQESEASATESCFAPPKWGIDKPQQGSNLPGSESVSPMSSRRLPGMPGVLGADPRGLCHRIWHLQTAKVT